MTHSLAKYHIRSPRYILQPQDNTLIRVAGPKQIPWEEGTDIKNISLTGIAFTAPSDICPSIGEFIKIEYEVPGSQKMACYALVTRLEDLSTEKTLVGVKFYRMDLPQRIILAQGLAIRLREQQISRIRERRRQLGLLRTFMPIALLSVWATVYFYMCFTMWTQYFIWDR
jgi:hypothetical protein